MSAQVLTWHKTPTRRRKNGFRYSRFTETGRQYAVEKSEWLGQSAVPVVWRALRRNPETGEWDTIVSTHRLKSAAIKAATKHARSE